jgi:hypothetical protein
MYSEPDWAKPALEVLTNLRVRARRHVQAFSAIAKGYGRRRSNSRAFLYAGILELWTKHLGQQLVYSRSSDGVLQGALIVFFIACVEPILRGGDPEVCRRQDETPTARAIAGIIDKARTSTLKRKK